MKTSELLLAHFKICAPGLALLGRLSDDPYLALEQARQIAENEVGDDDSFLIRSVVYELELLGGGEVGEDGMLLPHTTPAGRLFAPEVAGGSEASCREATLHACDLLKTWLEGKVPR